MNNDDIEEIYNEYFDLVYRYLCSISGDAILAEDLTQETFYHAMKGIRKFRGECKISVWLCQIAKNLWYKELRSKNRDVISIDDMLFVPSNENIEEQYLINVDKISYFKALHHLDELSRELVYLRITGELSFSQIGEILGRSENWARVSFYRCKQKILKGIRENGEENGM